MMRFFNNNNSKISGSKKAKGHLSHQQQSCIKEILIGTASFEIPSSSSNTVQSSNNPISDSTSANHGGLRGKSQDCFAQ
jgi:hypothetical protein